LIAVSKPEPLVGQTKTDSDGGAFDTNNISLLCDYLPFLYAALPVGDPLRATAKVAYDLAIERLASPSLWVTGPRSWMGEEHAKELDKSLEGLGELVGGIQEGRTLRRFPGGAVLRQNHNATLFIRPVEAAKAHTTLAALHKQIGGYD